MGSTPGFVAQVVTPLIRQGWVRSDPGPSGGYSLAVALDAVSVLAVIEAIEGPTATGRCVLTDRPCNEIGTCAPCPVVERPVATVGRAGSDSGGGDLSMATDLGRATDVGQDADVVQSGEVLRVQSQPSTQTHADPRRASHVLGWLPEPEVGGHGERHQQV